MVQSFDSSIKQVALAYTKVLNLNVTGTSLRRDLEENPYYPSLLSVSDIFTRYNVANNAYRVSSENFGQLEAPFIAFANMPSGGSDFVLVTAISEKTVSYTYNSDKPQIVEKNQFLKQFKNVVFVAEPCESSGERHFADNLRKERVQRNRTSLLITVAAITLLGIISADITMATAASYSIITIIKLAGLAISVLLLVYETDKSNAFVKNICSAGAKTNCDAVLGSEAAKLWGVSWGEIGFFYFAFTALLLVTPGMPFTYKTACLAVANALAVPYILFSIYYQRRIAKQWCLLCLIVQALLAAELGWSLFYFWLPVHSFSSLSTGGLKPLPEIAALALLPIVAWYSIKLMLLKAKDHDVYKSAFKRLQYNPEIFNSLLVQQATAADNWQHLGIIIGNPLAPNTIIKVCNPYCGPCAKAHPKLEEIIRHNNNLNLRIIFTAKNNDNDRSATVVKHLLAIASQNDPVKTQQAFDDWYLAPNKDYELFAMKYPMNGELKQQDAKIEAMSDWCTETEITATPTIFVNGYRLPENYDIEELRYIL